MAAQRDVYVRMRMAFTFAVALLDFGSSGNASNRRCLPSFVAAVGQFRLMPQMWCGLDADAWFENMSVYVNLRVGTPMDCFGIAPPVRFSFDLTSSSVFTAGFYNLGKPSQIQAQKKPTLQTTIGSRIRARCWNWIPVSRHWSLRWWR